MSELSDKAQRMYSVIAPPDRAPETIGGHRGEAWGSLTAAILWTALAVWILCDFFAPAALSATTTWGAVIEWVGVAIFSVQALFGVALILIVVLSGALKPGR